MANNDYENESLVPPFGRKDIERITKEVTADEYIELNIYGADLTLESASVVKVTNEEKRKVIESVNNKLKDLKHCRGEVHLPGIESDGVHLLEQMPFTIVNEVAYWEDIDLMYYAVKTGNYGVGFFSYGADEDGNPQFGAYFSGYETWFLQALLQVLLSNPTQVYIRFKFRIEK